MLARDLEAGTRKGAGKTTSIGRKANLASSLAPLLVIIPITAQSTHPRPAGWDDCDLVDALL
jgi:hypothetical protein